MERKIDYNILFVIIILSLFGLVMVYSASNVVAKTNYLDSLYFFKRQVLFLCVGYILMILIININIKTIKKNSVLLFIMSLLLLIIVIIPGVGVVRGGARSWISIGSFSIQPSEFMKIGLIIFLSKYLSNYYKEVKNTKVFIYLSIIILIIFFLIMLQPDFGTGLVIVLSSFIFLYISGANIRCYVVLGIVCIISAVFLIISAPYRLERITSFINPWQDPLGSGFQGIQSLFAITPSGLLGHGFNNSIQKHFFLPEPQNDFIFAIVIEEFGLIGGGIVVFMYLVLIYRVLNTALNTDDLFCKFLMIGLSLTLAVQVFINIGVVSGALPVTGITLPLFSYGGSSLIINFISFGLILNCTKYKNVI